MSEEGDVVKRSTMLQRLLWAIVIVVWPMGIGWSVAIAQTHDSDVLVSESSSIVFQPGEPSGLDVVHAVVDAVGAASAQAHVTQVQIGNVMAEGVAASHALVRDSFKSNMGIFAANQNAGNLNNQANVQVVAHVASAGRVIQLGDVTVEQRLVNNTMITSGAARSDRIENSFGGTVGIVGINQSAGHLNNQANVVVLTLGKSSGFAALEDSSLGKVNSGNKLIEGPPGPKSDVITGSFSGFRGVAQVSQSAGDLNQVSNTVNVSVSAMALK